MSDIGKDFAEQALENGNIPCGSNIPKMSKEKLENFISEYLSNLIFTSAMIEQKDLITMIFMPIIFMEEFQYPDYTNQIGIIWEYYKDALPRSINSYPTFMSCHLMHKDDWAIVVPIIKQKMQLIKDIKIE